MATLKEFCVAIEKTKFDEAIKRSLYPKLDFKNNILLSYEEGNHVSFYDLKGRRIKTLVFSEKYDMEFICDWIDKQISTGKYLVHLHK